MQPYDPKSYGSSAIRWIASAGSDSIHCQRSIEGADGRFGFSIGRFRGCRSDGKHEENSTNA